MTEIGKSRMPGLRFPEFHHDGTWRAMPLSDLCDRVVEKVGDTRLTPVSITAGRGYVSQAEKFGRDISGAQYEHYIHLRRGDFAYNRGNSNLYPQGCVYRLREFEEAAASNAFICFRLRHGNAPGFFEGLFAKNAHGRQLTKFLTSGARSDGLLNIKAHEFFSVRFPIPPRSAEQQKIADCLTSLDEVITAQRRQVEALKVHKRGLMQQLFPREGETLPRLRFHDLRDGPKWKETRLNQLGELIAGLTYSPSDVREEGMLVLRSSNIQNSEIALDDCVYVTPNIKGANLTEPNDILICVRNGSKSLIGKSALIPEGMPLCTHGAFMTVFRAHAPHFVFQLMQSLAFQRQVAADLGATINSINGGQLLKYRFVVPEPDEQNRIAECLSSLSAEIAAANKKLNILKTHKRGLMQRLFPSSDGD